MPNHSEEERRCNWSLFFIPTHISGCESLDSEAHQRGNECRVVTVYPASRKTLQLRPIHHWHRDGCFRLSYHDKTLARILFRVFFRRRCFSVWASVCVCVCVAAPCVSMTPKKKTRAVHCEWRDKCFSPSGPFIKPGLPFWLMKSGSRRAHRVLLSHRRGRTGEHERSHRPGCPLRPPPCLFSDNKGDSRAPHQLEVKKQLGHTLAILLLISDPILSFSEPSNYGGKKMTYFFCNMSHTRRAGSGSWIVEFNIWEKWPTLTHSPENDCQRRRKKNITSCYLVVSHCGAFSSQAFYPN